MIVSTISEEDTLVPEDILQQQIDKMGAKKTECCANCRFWQEIEATWDKPYDLDGRIFQSFSWFGLCRRYPPRKCGDDPDSNELPPTDGLTDWCGEHEITV